MNLTVALCLALAVSSALAARSLAQEASGEASDATPPALAFTMKSLAGEDVDLSRYAGRVVLIVNTASKCGHTPQYKGLQALHEKYGERGLSVLGFPCNQFGNQEPGTAEEIAQFCERNYGVTFDLFQKIDVNGDHAAPLYTYLTGDEAPIEDRGPVKWNFEKFLLDREGKLIARFRSGVKPDAEELTQAIESALGPEVESAQAAK